MKRCISIMLFLFSCTCFHAQGPISEANSKMNKAINYIDMKNYPAALTTMNDVINIQKGSKEYYLRASVHYYLTNYRAAIQDCNRALDYNSNNEQKNRIFFLKGLCFFELDDKESGISDMKKAGEDGIKFLEEQGIVEKPSEPQRKTTQSGSSSKRANTTPILKKTK